ncbi:hypothetical protein ACJJIW_20915 [Microbulbifer sp. JMSA004]|uniref:hypothetical protein n=1 Tax=unclassified Microbulbifer TaxID=2619833 RepID=UPI0024AD8405|nr:hypothetical protein [Microbulbifer sp. VAAF005]WHI46411.1 hypothetical protein P0078_22320 [Microbulbifer sp. VAAF005]
MGDIKVLASKVVSSSTAQEEERALESVWEYVYKNRIYVEILSVDSEGGKADINNLEGLSGVVKVQAIFSKGDQSFTLEWEPHELDNVFILYREK